MNRTIILYCGSAALPCAANPIRGEGQTRNEDERYGGTETNGGACDQPAMRASARLISVFLRCSVPPCESVASVHSVSWWR
jgi:hypothetical protein